MTGTHYTWTFSWTQIQNSSVLDRSWNLNPSINEELMISSDTIIQHQQCMDEWVKHWCNDNDQEKSVHLSVHLLQIMTQTGMNWTDICGKRWLTAYATVQPNCFTFNSFPYRYCISLHSNQLWYTITFIRKYCWHFIFKLSHYMFQQHQGISPKFSQ